MAKVRILDLAKDLGVEAGEVLTAARDCGVAASGPTSMLTTEDRDKLSKSIKSAGDKDAAGSKSGARTLTLNKPLVAGQTRSGAKPESGGRKVQVEVRRSTRRTLTAPTPTATPPAKEAAAVSPAKAAAAKVAASAKAAAAEKPAAPAKAVASAKPTAEPDTAAKANTTAKPNPVAKAADKPVAAAAMTKRSTLSPAQAAAQAVERQREEAAKATQARNAARATRSSAKPTARPTPPASGGQRSQASRPGGAARPANRPGNRPGGPQGRRDSNTGQRSSGPRTTIRRGLTPAQIAAAKAPSSSLKSIEEKIKKERAEQRAQRGQGRPGGAQRPGSASGGASARQPGRAPSVAVAPDAGAGGPQGPQRRRPGGGGPQGNFQRRRLSPAEKAARRAYSAKRNVVMTDEQEDRMARLARGGRRRQMITKDDADFVKRDVEIPESIAISELASRMAIKNTDVLRKLLDMGMTATAN
ncbi:MAG: translation initiation factor IF-2, partial [Mariprofundaceae bacterium]|nr:translation initiation factor IF-2 [Mariprofundaceae bacterium]